MTHFTDHHHTGEAVSEAGEKVSCTGIILSEELGFNVSLKENTNNLHKRV
jgi:hypothetical protein